jgi:hypothetical protein
MHTDGIARMREQIADSLAPNKEYIIKLKKQLEDYKATLGETE